MKKVLFILFNLLTITAMAQDKGRFEVYDLDNFKLHVYYTNDALGDASYIIEGTQELVTMEQPLFRDNVAEFDRYLASLGKPVVRRITDYHVGGTGDHATVMAEGMPEFTKGEIYGGMMQGFAATFGNALADFPGASILIGGKVYYTHWAPAKAHPSSLQISSPAAVDAEIAEARKALASGATLFIGGHGGAADADAVRFKIDYLENVRHLLAEHTSREAFLRALNEAYPGLPGAEGTEALAAALCGDN